MLHPTPELAAALVTGVAVDTLLQALGLAIFRPGPDGYFARNGLPVGWLLCVAVSCAIGVVYILGIHWLVPLAVWVVAALAVFKLPLRQTIRLLIFLALVRFGVALLFAGAAGAAAR